MRKGAMSGRNYISFYTYYYWYRFTGRYAREGFGMR